jgi:hypothetical protein
MGRISRDGTRIGREALEAKKDGIKAMTPDLGIRRHGDLDNAGLRGHANHILGVSHASLE